MDDGEARPAVHQAAFKSAPITESPGAAHIRYKQEQASLQIVTSRHEL